MPTKKKKVKKVVKKVKKPKTECLLELEGNVFIVEKKNGVVTSREPLDGMIVLRVLLKQLENAVKFEFGRFSLKNFKKKDSTNG